MTRVRNLDCDSDIKVYIPGPPGPPIVNINTLNSPSLITSSIAAPLSRRQRTFISGNGGAVNNPIIASPADNGPWEFYLFATDDTNTITLENQSNIKLSGQWIGKNSSQICLHWDGVSKYVEAFRNEI